MEFPRYDHQASKTRMNISDPKIALHAWAHYQAWNKKCTSVQAYRAIRTGKLNALLRLHTQPINVVVFHGSRRDLVLRQVSRLDAFSGYLFRT